MEIRVKADDRALFHNQVDYCIGTGRMGLALHQEYHDQLKMAQEYIGFQYIRGHGLFCDDMAIYQEFRENPWDTEGPYVVEYNFTYFDRVMDDYRSLGLKPFLELGFMPGKMASGTQTVFYWKGNTTPPKSYEDWKKMVQALLRHLIDRYGEEAYSYPIEVWNEPNLPGFWENADMQEYFRLFKESFEAIKEVDSRFRVGGPAVCGGSDEEWISAFMEFCHVNQIPVDFVTRHHYTTERPEWEGHYGYAELMDQEFGFANLHTTREIIDRYPEYKGLEIHITEFNTSYIPKCPVHDTNQNAAYIARQLSRLGDENESYTYWTFGDVFEEQGVPFTPFHGGFGLVANGCIPKPTFWTFVFFKNLKKAAGECVFKNDNAVIMRTKDGGYRGILWNDTVRRSANDIKAELSLEAACGEYFLLTKRVDEKTCNPLKVWHDMGEPAYPDAEQNRLLQDAAQPEISSRRICVKEGENQAEFSVELPEHAVVYFEIKSAPLTPDRGYHYERVTQQQGINPLIGLDYPDPDVIRVKDTYYMVSTTMYYMPGCEILRSYDLVHWEHAAYVYDRLDSTPAQKLEGEENIYGQGMWAASLRYHNGTFVVCFVANDTHKTYLYRATDIRGPWEKSEIEGFYHDNSILFDDDGRIFIVSGNREIYLTELKEDLSGPKEGGSSKIILKDREDAYLGYEGSHFYKIDGKYYLFMIHIPRETGMRTQSCFVADAPEGPYEGGDILSTDREYCGMGVAQGGIVDTPEGNWYSVLFQDSGAVGRIPVLIPMKWEDGKPVLGQNGQIPHVFKIEDNRPGYEYAPLTGCDDFRNEVRENGSFGFKNFWQFNHEPDMKLIDRDLGDGTVRISTDKVSRNVVHAKNILTQKTFYPGCAAQVTVDGSGLAEGDYAGLCLMESNYAYLALTRSGGKLYLVMKKRTIPGDSIWGLRNDTESGEEIGRLELDTEKVTLRAEIDFTRMKDCAILYYSEQKEMRPFGPASKLRFLLDHFTGVRFGLFVFSTEKPGGSAVFSNFIYQKKNDGIWENC